MRDYALAVPAVSVALPLKPVPFLYYRGFSVRETAGAVASAVIYDGTSAAGSILDVIGLAANGVAGPIYGPAKIARIGIYVSVLAGAFTGSIFFD